ncbi:MAG: hypothetical protein Q9218_005369 [Villophora microphyllina]
MAAIGAYARATRASQEETATRQQWMVGHLQNKGHAETIRTKHRRRRKNYKKVLDEEEKDKKGENRDCNKDKENKEQKILHHQREKLTNGNFHTTNHATYYRRTMDSEAERRREVAVAEAKRRQEAADAEEAAKEELDKILRVEKNERAQRWRISSVTSAISALVDDRRDDAETKKRGTKRKRAKGRVGMPARRRAARESKEDVEEEEDREKEEFEREETRRRNMIVEYIRYEVDHPDWSGTRDYDMDAEIQAAAEREVRRRVEFHAGIAARAREREVRLKKKRAERREAEKAEPACREREERGEAARQEAARQEAERQATLAKKTTTATKAKRGGRPPKNVSKHPSPPGPKKPAASKKAAAKPTGIVKTARQGSGRSRVVGPAADNGALRTNS